MLAAIGSRSATDRDNKDVSRIGCFPSNLNVSSNVLFM